MNRRDFVRLGLIAPVSMAASASSASISFLPGIRTIPLWPSVSRNESGGQLEMQTVERSPSPGAYRDRVLSGISSPALFVFPAPRPDGSAVLLVPGGGYSFETFDAEGVDVALRMNEGGVTAFVLLYRLPGEGWKDGKEVPLQDAQRAMRIIRAIGVTDYGIDPVRVGVMGFSAGGHLVGTLAERFAATAYPPVDSFDTLDARPNFAALFYPVVTCLPPFAHEASCTKLLGPDAPPALRQAYSLEPLVTADMPPCFLCAAADDADVPIENTLALYEGLRAKRVACELHIFEKGGHGFAVRRAAGLPAAAWTNLLFDWGASHAWFRSVPA